MDSVLVGDKKFCESKHPFLENEELQAIADRNNKTSAQIVLRYLVELGVVPIPKTANETRLRENVDIFDFSLSADDLHILDGMHNGTRIVKMSDAKQSKYWPFNLEF